MLLVEVVRSSLPSLKVFHSLHLIRHLFLHLVNDVLLGCIVSLYIIYFLFLEFSPLTMEEQLLLQLGQFFPLALDDGLLALLGGQSLLVLDEQLFRH